MACLIYVYSAAFSFRFLIITKITKAVKIIASTIMVHNHSIKESSPLLPVAAVPEGAAVGTVESAVVGSVGAVVGTTVGSVVGSVVGCVGGAT